MNATTPMKAVSWHVETAPPVITKAHKTGITEAHSLLGLYDAVVACKPCAAEYERDSDLSNTEQMPLLEEGGNEAFIRRQVLSYTPDAWVHNDATKIGYEINFARHVHTPQQLRTVAQLRQDIIDLEREACGLLEGAPK